MNKNLFLIISSFFSGIILSLFFILYSFYSPYQKTNPIPIPTPTPAVIQKQVIGFLPYWLLSKADQDYSSYITTLAYFALRINNDGSIITHTQPTESEPGWYALISGKANAFLQQAKAHKILLSLVIDSGDIHTIDAFTSTPEKSADMLVSHIKPIMQQNGFTDLNLDIEYTKQASIEARMNFVEFVKAVKEHLPNSTTLTLEISPIDTLQNQLIDIKGVSTYADHIVIMTYDYHATDSLVTGPVAPLFGAGIVSEFDVATAVNNALQFVPPQKLILGVPLYGYEWETIGTAPRSAVIPGSGVLASNNRVETFLASCGICKVTEDTDAQEPFISYFSNDTHTNHIIVFPDKNSTSAKITFANEEKIGGLALWALGYEGNTILSPLTNYKNSH